MDSTSCRTHTLWWLVAGFDPSVLGTPQYNNVVLPNSVYYSYRPSSMMLDVWGDMRGICSPISGLFFVTRGAFY